MNFNSSALLQRRPFFYTLLLTTFLWFALPQTAHAQGPIRINFSTNNGFAPFQRGDVVNTLTIGPLTVDIDVQSRGAHDVAMIFDTSNPGTFDPDLGAPNQACPGGGPGEGVGGEPGGLGPNCKPLGNALIIPTEVPPAPGGPNDDRAGGVITLTFNRPVKVNMLQLLDIEENGLDILMRDPSGTQIGQIFQPEGLGNNSYEEFVVNIPNVQSIVFMLPGSGAIAGLDVTPWPADTASLGDYVWIDENGDGIQNESAANGLNGVTVELLNQAGAVITTTQTANSPIDGFPGYYLFDGLAPGTYSVRFVRPQGYLFTTPNASANNKVDSDANLSTGQSGPVTLAAGDFDPSIDAGLIVSQVGSIGDTIWCDADGNGVPDAGEGLAGVTVILSGPISATTQTDANGNYLFSNLPLGEYAVSVDRTTLPTTCNIPSIEPDDTLDNQSVTLITETVPNDLDQDFAYVPPAPNLGSIGDTIWCDVNGNGAPDPGEGLAGVTVLLTGPVGGSTQTDGNGNYLFASLPLGEYTVSVDRSTLPTSCNIPSIEPDDTLDNQSTTVLTESVPNDLDQDFAYVPPATVLGSIGDTIWCDADGNAMPDAGEGLAGVTVQITGPISATTQTDADGFYLFENLPLGTYTVSVDRSTLPTTCNLPSIEPDGTLDNQSSTTLTETTPNDLTQDFAYVPPAPGNLSAIGDRVWLDVNNNGIQDEGEPGQPNVTVTLFDAAGQSIDSMPTDENGLYLFSQLPAGSYSIGVALPTGYTFSPPNQGDSDARDSDVATDTGRTPAVTLAEGETNLTVDAGLYQPLPELHIRKSDSGGVVFPGSVISYTLVFSNSGDAGAIGVTVTELVPNFTTFLPESSTPGWSCAGGEVSPGTTCTFEVGELAAGATDSLLFAVRVDATLPDTVVQIANNVVISDNSGRPGGSDSDVVVSRPQEPNALEEGEEPTGLNERIYIPVVVR